MKKFTLLAFLILAAQFDSFAQGKLMSEFTVVYELSVEDAKADPALVKSMAGTTKTVYIKNSKSRSDLNSPAYSQTTIHDSKTDSTVILRELGNAKYISYLDENKRVEKNKKFEGITFSSTNETKAILGYECKKVVASLKDGSTFNVYYAPSIIPSTKGYEYQFKDLPGFVMEYETESEKGKVKVKYSATKISLTAIPNIKFDVPTSGYRVL